MLLFTSLLSDLGSQKPSTSTTKTLERGSMRQRKTKLRITKYSAMWSRPTARWVRSGWPLALSVWGHLWHLSPWAGVAAMTYSANLKGYSIPWSLRPHGLWCHTSLRHLRTFRARRRDWIVLWPTHVCGCVPGRINSLLATFQSVLLLFFPSLFFSKQSDFHTGRSLPSSPGLGSSSALLR